MKLFKKKEREEVIIDTRSELEKRFEEKGQEIGRKTGTIAQKTVDKIHQVKQKLEDDGTMDKLRTISDKIDDTIDNVVDKAVKQGKRLKKKSKSSKSEEGKDDELYYE